VFVENAKCTIAPRIRTLSPLVVSLQHGGGVNTRMVIPAVWTKRIPKPAPSASDGGPAPGQVMYPCRVRVLLADGLQLLANPRGLLTGDVRTRRSAIGRVPGGTGHGCWRLWERQVQLPARQLPVLADMDRLTAVACGPAGASTEVTTRMFHGPAAAAFREDDCPGVLRPNTQLSRWAACSRSGTSHRRSAPPDAVWFPCTCLAQRQAP